MILVAVLLMYLFNNSFILSAEYSSPIVNCTIYKENLTISIASFTSCAISYSRPIKFCERCVSLYMDLLRSYQNLSMFQDDDGPCIDNYINLDRLEIIQTLYENSIDLWNRAKCYECFKIVNSSLTKNLSVETITFNNLFENLTTCINRTDVNDTALCSICLDDYNNLNDYYISISNENEKIGVCMDIVDMMNGTRSYWSNKCCKFRHKDERIFLICTVLVTCSTILFYILTKLCSEKKIPILMKQTRFAGSFNQVVDVD